VSATTEQELLLAAKENAEKQGELVAAFGPLIAGIAGQHRRTIPAEHPELMRAGTVGLLRALDGYDPTLGTPFWAYASWWVRLAMVQLTAERSRPIV
jgi:RNA polymerase primary sigma factor